MPDDRTPGPDPNADAPSDADADGDADGHRERRDGDGREDRTADGSGDPLRPAPGARTGRELLAFGVLNLDKPPGPDAHQVSAWVREIAGVGKAAHAGTLDPTVTGCLPVLLGAATRLAGTLVGPKEYVAVLELHAPAPPAERVRATLREFEGPLYQKPPRKSAVRRELRVRTVHELRALSVERRRVLIEVRCEAGTYVRKLCHDLGLALGTGGQMGALRRTAADPFDDRDLVTLHDLADAVAFHRAGDADPPQSLREVVAPAERALERAGVPRVVIDRAAARNVATGAPVYAPGVRDIEAGARGADRVVCVTPDGAAVCLGRVVGDPDADAGVVVDLERVLV